MCTSVVAGYHVKMNNKGHQKPPILKKNNNINNIVTPCSVKTPLDGRLRLCLLREIQQRETQPSRLDETQVYLILIY